MSCFDDSDKAHVDRLERAFERAVRGRDIERGRRRAIGADVTRASIDSHRVRATSRRCVCRRALGKGQASRRSQLLGVSQSSTHPQRAGGGSRSSRASRLSRFGLASASVAASRLRVLRHVRAAAGHAIAVADLAAAIDALAGALATQTAPQRSCEAFGAATTALRGRGCQCAMDGTDADAEGAVDNRHPRPAGVCAGRRRCGRGGGAFERRGSVADGGSEAPASAQNPAAFRSAEGLDASEARVDRAHAPRERLPARQSTRPPSDPRSHRAGAEAMGRARGAAVEYAGSGCGRVQAPLSASCSSRFRPMVRVDVPALALTSQVAVCSRQRYRTHGRVRPDLARL